MSESLGKWIPISCSEKHLNKAVFPLYLNSKGIAIFVGGVIKFGFSAVCLDPPRNLVFLIHFWPWYFSPIPAALTNTQVLTPIPPPLCSSSTRASLSLMRIQRGSVGNNLPAFVGFISICTPHALYFCKYVLATHDDHIPCGELAQMPNTPLSFLCPFPFPPFAFPPSLSPFTFPKYLAPYLQLPIFYFAL